MANLLGDDWRLYYDTADDWANATFVQQTDLGDLGFEFNPEQVEVPKRQTHKVYKSGRQDWMLSFNLNANPGATFYDAVEAAIEAGSSLHLALANGDITANGTKYWHADWNMYGNIEADLDSNSQIPIEAKCSATSNNTPVKVTVGS